MAKGFHRRTYLLDFSDPTFHGLEVRARGCSLEQAMELQRCINLGGNIGAAGFEADRRRWFELLAELIIEWNLLDEQDRPVPITPEAIAQEEFTLLSAICVAYLLAVVSVSAPLPQPSSDGPSSLEGFDIPMEPLSESPPSL